METATKETVKFLLIGEERICKQVAYVMSFDKFEIKSFDLLTEENIQSFTDFNIYVCDFKRKCSRQVKAVGLKSVKYLEDICREIDRDCFLNRAHNKKLVRQQLKKVSLLTRIKLWGYEFLKTLYFRFISSKSIHAAKKLRYGAVTNVKSLRCLKPSKLLLYVLNAPISKTVQCSLVETGMFITSAGEVFGCCSMLVPFGNLFHDGDLDKIYNSTYARIVKLSSLNRSYCLCNQYGFCPTYIDAKSLPLKPLQTVKVPAQVTVAIDRTCNLCCKSCRNKRFVMDKLTQTRISLMANKIQQSGYLDKTNKLYVAGQGEVFYSPYYRQLVETKLQRKNIVILSNGTLFNEKNWNWLKDKYETIDVIISVDAATADTYKKLRGADFNALMKNLETLANLHRQKQIRKFNLNFVVQRDNYREMIKFVELGRALGVDQIEFQHMNNFGNLTKKEYLQRCMIVKNKYLDKELWQVLRDPIFQEPIVDLSGLKRYMVAMEEKE